MKWELRTQLKDLHREFGHTMIYVTHDQTEALTFAQKVVVMHEGRVVRGSARRTVRRPLPTFVGYFIGSPGMDLFDAGSFGKRGAAGSVSLPLGAAYGPTTGRTQIGITPDYVTISDQGLRYGEAGRGCGPTPHHPRRTGRTAAERDPAGRGAYPPTRASASLLPRSTSTPTTGARFADGDLSDGKDPEQQGLVPCPARPRAGRLFRDPAVDDRGELRLNDTSGQNEFFWEGIGWFEEMLSSDRLHDALVQQVLFSVIILAIEVPLGIFIALNMPKSGFWSTSC